MMAGELAGKEKDIDLAVMTGPVINQNSLYKVVF